jgi:hypothetical protein
MAEIAADRTDCADGAAVTVCLWQKRKTAMKCWCMCTGLRRITYQKTALNSNRQLAYRLAGVSALIWGLIRTSEAKYLSGRNVSKNENKVYS